jgi:hypothetical protein
VDAADGWARRAEAAVGEGELAGEAAFARRASAAVVLALGDPTRAADLVLDAAARADDTRAAVAPAGAGFSRQALVDADERERASEVLALDAREAASGLTVTAPRRCVSYNV